MLTHPDEYDYFGDARLARYVSPEDFDKIQKARNEAFSEFVNFFISLVRRIFRRKTA